MNLKIKFRESFRPFAPCVLQSHVDEYFEMRDGEDSPYMLLVADVRKDKLMEHHNHSAIAHGFEKLEIARSVIPAVTHVDHSARVQTIDTQRNPFCFKIIEAFHRKTGVPVIINTSFNIRGEPIVCSPEDAYRCFLATGMDVLIIGKYLLRKEHQKSTDAAVIQKHLNQFALD